MVIKSRTIFFRFFRPLNVFDSRKNVEMERKEYNSLLILSSLLIDDKACHKTLFFYLLSERDTFAVQAKFTLRFE